MDDELDMEAVVAERSFVCGDCGGDGALALLSAHSRLLFINGDASNLSTVNGTPFLFSNC